MRSAERVRVALALALVVALQADAAEPGYGKVETFQPGKKYTCVPTPDRKGWDCRELAPKGERSESRQSEPVAEPKHEAPHPPAPARAEPAPQPPAVAPAAPPPAPAVPRAAPLPAYLRAPAARGSSASAYRTPAPESRKTEPQDAESAAKTPTAGSSGVRPSNTSPPTRSEDAEPAAPATGPVAQATPAAAEPKRAMRVQATPPAAPPAEPTSSPTSVSAPAAAVPAGSAAAMATSPAATTGMAASTSDARSRAASAPKVESTRTATAPAPGVPSAALGNGAFLRLPAAQFVVEVAHGQSRSDLDAVLSAVHPGNGRLYELHMRRDGGDWWVLVWGTFDSIESARRARATLAGTVKAGWPRRIAPLQAEVRRAGG